MQQEPATEAEKPTSKVEQHRKEFVDKILDLMQQEKMFWQRPWEVTDLMPVNAVSKKAYRGCNIPYLLFAGMQKGYGDPRWLTYKQAHDKGWQVKKGEKGTKIEFWSVLQKDNPDEQADEDSEGDHPHLFCRIYTVFNASQVDGIPALEKKEQDKKGFTPHEKGERIIDNCGVPIHYGGGAAFYRSSEDKIYLPDRERFKDEAHFYATALHEIAHSTGHPSRLNRELGSGMRSPKYAREELRAEMASAFMQMELGFALTAEGMSEHTEKHAAYIQHWLEHLKEDYKEFYRATQDAVKIADYVLAYDTERIKTQNREAGMDFKPPRTLACGVARQTLIIRKLANSAKKGVRSIDVQRRKA
jgi:antirestriction protein ArdC